MAEHPLPRPAQSIVALAAEMTIRDAAKAMRDRAVTEVIVLDGNNAPYDIVTERDIVVRVVAAGQCPEDVTLSDICGRRSATDVESMRGESPVRRFLQGAVGGDFGGQLGAEALVGEPDSPLYFRDELRVEIG